MKIYNKLLIDFEFYKYASKNLFIQKNLFKIGTDFFLNSNIIFKKKNEKKRKKSINF
jgi:hypothetical protein